MCRARVPVSWGQGVCGLDDGHTAWHQHVQQEAASAAPALGSELSQPHSPQTGLARTLGCLHLLSLQRPGTLTMPAQLSSAWPPLEAAGQG